MRQVASEEEMRKMGGSFPRGIGFGVGERKRGKRKENEETGEKKRKNRGKGKREFSDVPMVKARWSEN